MKSYSNIEHHIDFKLIFAVAILILLGLLMVYSASTGEYNQFYSGIWKRQAVWALVSFGIIIGMIQVPPRFFFTFAYIFYFTGIGLLIFTITYGSMAGGSERWLSIAGIRFQPSELMKVAVVLALGRYLSGKDHRPTKLSKCVVPLIMVIIPMVLVQMQPDLGTALVFGAMLFPMLYWSGLDPVKLLMMMAIGCSAILTAPFIPFFSPTFWMVFMFGLLVFLFYKRYSFAVIALVLGINILVGVATPLAFNQLKPYQQRRITTIFNPEADPLGAGYQIIHSKIALGSGGFTGKGIGAGRFIELGFLPHAHTDFIFSVVGEQLGFVGGVVVLLLFLFIVFRGIIIGYRNSDSFMSVTAIGIAAVFAFHTFVNVGMVLGIMPVTGLPLPFLSYGGSSCIANAALVGILLNFNLNRHAL